MCSCYRFLYIFYENPQRLSRRVSARILGKLGSPNAFWNLIKLQRASCGISPGENFVFNGSKMQQTPPIDQSLIPFSQHLLVEYLFQLLLKTPNPMTNASYAFWTDDLKRTLKMTDLVLSCLKHDMALKCCSEHKGDNKHCACTCACDRPAALSIVYTWKKDIEVVWNMMNNLSILMNEDRQRREVFDHFKNVASVVQTICAKDAPSNDVVFDSDTEMDMVT